MCGIAGVIGVETSVARAAAEQMRAALRHRGPDDDGIATIAMPGRPPVVLVHTRLSIVDLSSAGHQPMFEDDAHAGLAISFNGEVYNHAELRQRLQSLGHAFRSRTDTEVILRAHREFGPQAVESMRGMFAWAIADARRGEVLLCRDRMGIKPLYVARVPGGGLVFASEVRAILASGLIERVVDRSAVESFLAQGAVFGPQTIVSGVESVEPGHSLTYDARGELKASRRYWAIPWTTSRRVVESESGKRDLHALLRESIRLRLLADVPVGVFLSGGIDSAAIATLATEVAGGDVRTVTIGFDQKEFDESSAAARIAAQLGTQHSSIELTGETVVKDWDLVIAAMDQPTVDGFNTFFVSRAARGAGLKVALSGLGGDELFAGYASFRDIPRARRVHRVARRFAFAAGAFRRAARIANSRGAVKLCEWSERSGAPVQAYLLRRELFLPRERRTLHGVPAGVDPATGITLEWLSMVEERSAGLDETNQVSMFEIELYMRQMLLRDSDAFSMAHGLELRVPLLDHQVVEKVAAMSGSQKLAAGRLKPLLVDAVGARLPEASYQSPKRGFTFPWAAWLTGALSSRAAAAVEPARWKSGPFASSAPGAMWQRFQRRDPAVGGLQIIALMVLADYLAQHRLRTSA